MQQIKSILIGWIETSRFCLSFNKISWHIYKWISLIDFQLGRALNQATDATEDTSGEHAEAYQEYDVDPKERELLEQQNLTSVLEREPEGDQSLEMIDSPIETLYQSENEGLDVKSEDDENEFEDEEINDEEGEMDDENDMEDEHQMEDDHWYGYEDEHDDGVVSLI